jgi:hypothetical protein
MTNDKEPTKHTLIDLDYMEVIFEKADDFAFDIDFSENNEPIFGDDISWEFHEERE